MLILALARTLHHLNRWKDRTNHVRVLRERAAEIFDQGILSRSNSLSKLFRQAIDRMSIINKFHGRTL